MLPPIQNQDTLQRSETMSGLRSQEQGKAFGDVAKALAEMQRIDDLKNNTVQKNDETEDANPDGGGNQQQQQQGKKDQEEEKPETNTPAGHPLKLDGGDIIDLMA
ncbi:MAG: hypothetical protein LBU89_06340 [Fibromonadaceae bacterium]|jgi:hypothetical protein|nr:hypothetical protein [Fibromonadaceae bacterium]